MKILQSILTVAFLGISYSVVAQTDSVSRNVGEVVITGSRNAVDVRHLPMTVTVIGQEKLEMQNRQSILPTVMQQVPGVFVTSRAVLGYGVSGGGSGAVNMRGISGAAGQLLVLIDGHPQYQGIFGHPIADSYQTMMAEKVEVLRGPASVLYGSNAMGGVISIVTRSIETDGVRTNVNIGGGSYGTFMADAMNQVRNGKFSSTVSAEYGRSDNHRPHMQFEQYGGYLKLGCDIDNHWNTFINADVTHFDSRYPGSTIEPVYGAEQWITRGVMTAAIENNYERTSGAISVFSNFGRHKIDDGTKEPTQTTNRYFRSKDALSGVSVYQSAQLFAGNRITFGVDYQHIYGNAYYTDKNAGTVLIVANKQTARSVRHEEAAYIDFRQHVTNWFTVDFGVRIDHHSVTGTEWIPQVGVVLHPLNNADLKAMASKGFRNPTMREMYLYPPSNEELKPESLWNYELSWRHKFNNFTYGANLFYINGDNMIQTVPVDGKPRNVNIGKINNTGIEMEAAWQIDKHLTISTNHSLLNMEYKVLAAPTYKGFLGTDYYVGKLTISVNMQYIDRLYTSVGENEKTEDFYLLNINANYKLANWLQIWLRGENLLAQKYEINLGYPMPKATFMAGARFVSNR